MSTLQRLQIAGIRSFGPFENNVGQLNFLTPVTLILGQNGCGKTTIIESIRFACTGELPGGTSSGQGFVNDPKMTGSASTKGQIKLRLLDSKNNEITVARIVEVVQNATGLKFSSKNHTINIVDRDGNTRAVSGRCADITVECCRLMNVSASVINNVIFCHQDNSLWPLDEGKKVKEKFDEIFEAQRYNKCTDVMRADLKQRTDKLKILKIELAARRERKETVEKDRRKLQDKEGKLLTFDREINANKENLNPIKQRIEEICELENVLGDLQRQLATKEETRKGVIEQQNNVKRNITFEFEGTDQDLQDKIQSFEDDRQKEQTLIQQLEDRQRAIERKAKEIVDSIQASQLTIAKLNQEKNQHQKKCEEMKKLIKLAEVDFNKKIDLNCNKPLETAKTVEELKAALADFQTTLNKLIESKENEERDLQKNIDNAREVNVTTKQNIESKKKETESSKQKVDGIKLELEGMSNYNDLLKNVTAKIANNDNIIANLKEKFQETEESQRMEDFKRDIQDKELSLQSLESDYRILQQNDINEGKIESEKHSIIDKQRYVNKIKTKHSSKLSQLFGNNIPETKLKEAIENLQRKEDLAVKHLTENITKKQKEVTLLEAQRKTLVDKVATVENELKIKEKKISEACERGKTFTETVENCTRKREKLQRDKGQYSSLKIIYEKFLEDFENEKPCCPVCETSFQSRNDAVKKIIKTIRNKIEKVPRQLMMVEEELRDEEDNYTKLQQLKFLNEEIKSLADVQLPQLKNDLTETSTTLKRETGALENLKRAIQTPQNNLEICRSIVPDVASLEHYMSDIQKSEKSVSYLEELLVQLPSNKSKQEVEAEIDNLKSDIAELRRKIDSQQKKISSHKDRLQQLTTERGKFLNTQMTLKEGLQSQPSLENQKAELEEKILKLKEEIDDLESTFVFLDAELQNAVSQKENAAKKNKLLIQEERNKLISRKNLTENIAKVHDEIFTYLSAEVDANIVSTEEELTKLKANEEALNTSKNKVIDLITRKREEIAKQEINFRTLNDNVLLREKKKQETVLIAEITSLKKRIGDYNYRTVYEEKQRLMKEKDVVERQINNIDGQRNELKSQIKELQQELEQPGNKNAFKDYLSKAYELKIAEHVVTDLDMFIQALEQAIIEFHREKMVQINRNIRELWRDVYRGNDIDYIEIKTEYAAGNARKRSYNYKVIQVKKGVELDMRGRCSAGQKVLACLIIRMALAETLSASCGILALDEPTTNLDRENILSLSDTLARVVANRQGEKNFQLIIITHDEEFLSTLTRVQGLHYYYRVSRDNEGFSIIRKEYT